MQLGFAVWPLMRFTSEKKKLGEFTNKLWLKILGWTTALIIITLNVKLLFDIFMPMLVEKCRASKECQIHETVTPPTGLSG